MLGNVVQQTLKSDSLCSSDCKWFQFSWIKCSQRSHGNLLTDENLNLEMIKVTGFLCSHVTLLLCCTCEPVTPTVLCISLESPFVGKSETCAESY